MEGQQSDQPISLRIAALSLLAALLSPAVAGELVKQVNDAREYRTSGSKYCPVLSAPTILAPSCSKTRGEENSPLPCIKKKAQLLSVPETCETQSQLMSILCCLLSFCLTPCVTQSLL